MEENNEPKIIFPDMNYQIMPVNKNNKNAIVFTINNDYVKYFGVALKSLAENSSIDKSYDIVVFADYIEEQNKERLNDILPPNFSLRFVDIEKFIKTQFDKLELITNDNWPYLVFYRCFIPFVMQHYEKVLYLDSDTLINKNIDNIFDIDLGNCTVGVCRDIIAILNKDLGKHNTFRKEVLKIENTQEYFNSGVILFDIRKIDINEYFEKFVSIANGRKLLCPDQDCLNYIFYGQTKLLPFEYNYQYASCIYEKKYQEMLIPIYKEKVEQAIKSPCIIHFLAKPWTTSKQSWGRLHDKFWEYAKKTPFYEEILLSAISKIYTNEIKSKCKKLSFLEKIFSVRNECINEDKYKVITFFGIKKKFLIEI